MEPSMTPTEQAADHPAVRVDGVNKIFNQGKPGQVDALVDIDLTVAPGEFVSLIGPSGCGNSTLLRVVADRYPPELWNIYAAQASDGDNDPRDNQEVINLLSGDVLETCQYYAYLEVNEPGHGSNASSLWRAYADLGFPNLAQRSVTHRVDIYPIFRELFSRSETVRGRPA